jgi:hypothetical protein
LRRVTGNRVTNQCQNGLERCIRHGAEDSRSQSTVSR